MIIYFSEYIGTIASFLLLEICQDFALIRALLPHGNKVYLLIQQFFGLNFGFICYLTLKQDKKMLKFFFDFFSKRCPIKG